ncbi:MAG: DUF669 domain-containing protein [Clostridia bacterium]|nr:DUF669 domain-containing protein [Schwartzia sp. (in: firmicutes)]MBQ9714695.1 DUF669 domain-containing protein [Clostridia bacterium]
MTPINGYHEAQAIQGGGEALPAGGYKCTIVKAYEDTSKNGRPMLDVCLDISDGDHKGYFSRLYRSRKELNDKDGKDTKWPCIMYLLADDEAVGRFKGAMKAIEDSNPGYSWENSGWKEETLKGKAVGVVFREEEYEKRDGSIGVTTRAAWMRNVDKVEEAAVPSRKKMRQSIAATDGIAVDNEQIPF